MNNFILIYILQIFVLNLCNGNKVDVYFNDINNEVVKYNSIGADIAWEASVHPGNPELPSKSASYQRNRIAWQHNTCRRLAELELGQFLNTTQRRQTYLLCRGTIFNYNEARETSFLYEELQSIYSDAEICFPSNKIISKNNLTQIEEVISSYLSDVENLFKLETNYTITVAAKLAADGKIKKENVLCLNGEDEVGKLMSFSKNEEVLRWAWLAWREKIGPPMKVTYKELINIENTASKRNGYPDIGAVWRDELEVPKLKNLCRHLYASVRPLYELLHGVVRFFLRRHYEDLVPEKGPIPAHLLGNLWAQNWEPITNLIIKNNINLDESIRKSNWTVLHMVKNAEDFYRSLGLPALTDTFWNESIFERENNDAMHCHGTAADMYKNGDFRLLYCSGKSFEDFYVLHHEIGHIQYYMAYENQPGIFRQGANTAFHESIGDTIMLGVMTSQHLHRLGLINDTLLYTDKVPSDKEINQTADIGNDVSGNTKTNENTAVENPNEYDDLRIDLSPDEVLMLKQALNKLPHIPFALVTDEYRWKYFEGNIKESFLNKEFWTLALELQGIAPLGNRGEEYFDAGAKFHVPDNTPYIRYFLSSFLQHQIFETLCKASVFGRRGVVDPLPDTIAMNRCDIYGSKAAGKILKDIMSRGSSQHWREILQATTGSADIKATPLLRYYRPIHKLLTRLVKKYSIPIGWK